MIDRTTFLDTHQHLWDTARFSYRWMEELPALNAPHLIRTYREAAEGLNILGSVHIETDVDEADLPAETAWIFSLADNPAHGILGVVAGARLERENCFAHLEPFWVHPKLKGLRRVIHTQADEIMKDARFLSNLGILAQRGLSFDLCVLARQLPAALEVVKRFPSISFVLDHCGNPDIKSQALDPWRRHLRAFAEEPNVVCKVSGIAASVDPANWSAENFRPFVEHVIECFGWERVLWGSDWPVCRLTCSLRQWVEVVQELIQSHGCPK